MKHTLTANHKNGQGAVGTIEVCCPSCGEHFDPMPIWVDTVKSLTESIGNERIIFTLQEVTINHICRTRVS